MTVAEFMRTALTHPTLGYYTRSAKQFGEQGDFVTSVTMTPVYGELVGLWIVSMWQAAGCPAAWKLVEVGPGTGRLMSDVLRVVRKFAPAAQGVQVHLVDVSPALRREQAASLQVELPSDQSGETVSGTAASGIPVHWHARIAGVPCDAHIPELIVGHEILDALPAHQFMKTAAGWRERLVDVAHPDDAEAAADSTRSFQFITAQDETPALRACFAPAGSSERQANAVAALQAAAELERRGTASTSAAAREPQGARILQHPRSSRVLSEADVHHVHGDAGSSQLDAPSMLLDSAAAAAGKAGDAALMQSDDLLASIKAVSSLAEPGPEGGTWSSAPLSAADSPADHFAYSQLRSAPDELQAAADSAAIGTVVEFSPAAAGFAYEVSARVGTTGGAALLVDYGNDGVPESSLGTLRGIRHHKFVHALETPGEIDLVRDSLADAARSVRGVGLGALG